VTNTYSRFSILNDIFVQNLKDIAPLYFRMKEQGKPKFCAEFERNKKLFYSQNKLRESEYVKHCVVDVRKYSRV
jgi:hypothetical protein